MSPCIPFTDDQGRVVAFACTRGRRPPKCCACNSRGTFLCDFPMGSTKTCDRSICPEHAQRQGPDRHYCPEHWTPTRRAAG